MSHYRKKMRFSRIILHLVLLGTSLLMVSPFIWMFFTSFKPDVEIVTETPKFLPNTWVIEHYAKLPQKAPFFRFFLNGILVSSISTVFVLLGSAAAGYIFAKYTFRSLSFFFFLIITTILIPIQTYMVPLYLFLKWVGWINTYQGMIFPLIIMSSGIFFLRQHIRGSIPNDFIDAARIDGATEFCVFRTIILPLSISPLAAISIVNWIYTWSLFIWYLIVANSEDMFTMEVGLMYFQRAFSVDYGGIMAACMATIVPVLVVFLLFRTQIIEGVSFTGVKY
ncbi:MAG: carbohydrate ABC transporter permease [Candidatus Vecturithrix sp.]|nr:carbohydrate ABC transporter permease [Candidatus Vecturithrix sp.]